MNLDDTKWTTLNGGYKIPYNASAPLKKLHSIDKQELMQPIFLELWDNLHHQGDVGLASYYSVPFIVSICIDKKSFDWNFIGLIVIIEECRLSESNPSIPTDLEQDYFNSLEKFEEYLLTNFKNITDSTSIRLSLAFFAFVKGEQDLGRAIEMLDEDVIQEFLEGF